MCIVIITWFPLHLEWKDDPQKRNLKSEESEGVFVNTA